MNFDELIERLASFELDPLGFVEWAFPWGEPGGPLEHEKLEGWQRDFFDELGCALRAGKSPIRIVRTSGHGVGKSAVSAMTANWAMSTMPDTKGIITANTENQLRTKTWPEITKWHRMFIGRDLFKVTATAMFPRDPELERTWRLDMVPWSERNTEAFAGLHNKGRRVFLMMDEASAIPDVIHEVAEGALTDSDTQIIWIMFGNPTRNSGRLRETAPDGRFGSRWNFASVDSRSVRRTNKQLIEEWRQDYGEDSDFFRVRVKGEFPRQDAVSFISYGAVREATVRPIPERNEADVVLGVDVARFGDDCSVIYPRQGRDARSRPPEVYKGLSTMELAYRVRDAVIRYNPTMVFVDETGIGGGVVDVLRSLRLGTLIVGVVFSAKPDGLSEERYANKRAEIWGEMRKWIADGCIPEHVSGLDHTLVDDLCAPTYGFTERDELILESKKDIRRRGVASPDVADALACTFALPSIPRPPTLLGAPERPFVAPDYNPFELMEANDGLSLA